MEIDGRNPFYKLKSTYIDNEKGAISLYLYVFAKKCGKGVDLHHGSLNPTEFSQKIIERQ